jgi:hypothetical protein
MSSNVSKFLCVFCNFFVIYQKGSSILTFISKEHNGTGGVLGFPRWGKLARLFKS